MLITWACPEKCARFAIFDIENNEKTTNWINWWDNAAEVKRTTPRAKNNLPPPHTHKPSYLVSPPKPQNYRKTT